MKKIIVIFITLFILDATLPSLAMENRQIGHKRKRGDENADEGKKKKKRKKQIGQERKEQQQIETCSICSGELLLQGNNLTALPICKDVFHVSCIMQWFEWGNNSCPICIKPVFCNVCNTYFESGDDICQRKCKHAFHKDCCNPNEQCPLCPAEDENGFDLNMPPAKNHTGEQKKIKEEQEASQVRRDHLQKLGIEGELIPFVKDAKRVGNMLYIQLDCIDQFCKTLQRPVKEHYNAMVIDIYASFNMEIGKELPVEANPRIMELDNFEPSATCSSLVIRSLLKMKQFMLRRDPRDVSALEQLKRVEDGIQYFQGLIDRNEPTSWGDATSFTGLLGVNVIEKNNLQNETTFVQTVLQANIEHAQSKIQAKESSDSPFHFFVVSTGDVGAFNLIDKTFDGFMQAKENNSDIVLEKEDKAKIQTEEDSKRHYYAVVMQKRVHEVRYYIIDTSPYNDHINDQVYHLRNQYLAEMIATGQPTVDFRAYLAGPYAQEVVANFNLKKYQLLLEAQIKKK